MTSPADERLNDADWLRRKYLEEDLTQEEIAFILGCTDVTVSKWIRRHDIPTLYGTDLEERFWDKVDKTDSCWWWTASTQTDGYGQLGDGDGSIVLAHRLSYRLEHGAIPEGKQINHHCDNPTCVNPEHLYAGTKSENLEDYYERQA